MKFGTFNNPIDVIGTGKDVVDFSAAPKKTEDDKKLKPSESQATVVLEPLHDRAFRPAMPSKKGNHSTIAKFPQWKGDPPAELKRKVVDPEAEDIPLFKHTTKTFSRPTPSVATNFRNLKS